MNRLLLIISYISSDFSDKHSSVTIRVMKLLAPVTMVKSKCYCYKSVLNVVLSDGSGSGCPCYSAAVYRPSFHRCRDQIAKSPAVLANRSGGRHLGERGVVLGQPVLEAQ